MEIFRFAHPNCLYLLLLVPAVVAMLMFFARKRRKALNRFGDGALLEHLMPAYSSRRTQLKRIILLLAFTLQVIALAGPQFGARIETAKRKGIEIMIALDVSNSMNAMDIQPSRLEMGKMAISRLVDKLSNDRIGIVVYAATSFIQLPITSDYPSAKMFLSSINTGLISSQGTAIGGAIEKCLSSFTENEDINRAIIIISDGENHEDDACQAAARAAQMGVKVYTVGLGTTKGAPVPTTPGNMREFIKDKEGNVVISKLDEAMLASIAASGEGAYIPANNIRNGINALVDEINGIEKAEFETKVFSQYNDRFQWVEALVLVLLLVELLILGRHNPRLAGVDIFTRRNTKKDLFIQPSTDKQ